VYVNDIMKTHSVITRLRDLHFKYIFPVLLKKYVYDAIMTVWGRFCFSMLFHLLFANVVTRSVVLNDKVTGDQRNIPKPKKI